MKQSTSIAIETPQFWGNNYQLIDSGGFEKLEKFGEFTVRRPEPQAIWGKSLAENEWQKLSHAHFKKEKGGINSSLIQILKKIAIFIYRILFFLP